MHTFLDLPLDFKLSFLKKKILHESRSKTTCSSACSWPGDPPDSPDAYSNYIHVCKYDKSTDDRQYI